MCGWCLASPLLTQLNWVALHLDSGLPWLRQRMLWVELTQECSKAKTQAPQREGVCVTVLFLYLVVSVSRMLPNLQWSYLRFCQLCDDGGKAACIQ